MANQTHPRMIFVNLPVTDLRASIAFYQDVLQAAADPHFRDERSQMMRISDTICVMLLTRGRFADFTPKQVPDLKAQAQALLCLSADSASDVDAMVDRAGARGATLDPTPPEDMGGFMHGRSFEDPDGHIWEVMWMDVAAAMQADLGQGSLEQGSLAQASA